MAGRDLWLALAVGITVVAIGGRLADPSGNRELGQSASLTSTERAMTAVPERPFVLSIPSIGVRASLEPLGLTVKGSLAVPRDSQQVGWWAADGDLSADSGPVVLVGHRDSRTGPAVFYAAPSLLRGEPIRFTDGRGDVHHFVVDRVERHRREAFPTRAVYAATRVPSLRLLTCGGKFTPGKGYADNWIVFASAARPHAAPASSRYPRGVGRQAAAGWRWAQAMDSS